MDFQYTETQLLIQDTAQKFADEKLAPGAVERDEKEIFPREEVKEMASEFGVFQVFGVYFLYEQVEVSESVLQCPVVIFFAFIRYCSLDDVNQN